MDDNSSYRRSNLREALVDRALVVLEARGSDALSLRELARDLGVSHAAPARHFPSRRHLLDAVAVDGFESLTATVGGAIASTPDPQEQARLAARAYVAFAIEKANLVEVMFRHEPGRDGEAIGQSAVRALEPLLRVFERGEQTGVVSAGNATTTAVLFLSALQGIAALVNCGVVSPSAVADLVEDAVPRFIGPATDGGGSM
jgi:AcrR family transcriptional regulator